MLELDVRRMERERRPDFDRIHCGANGADWCHCVAWWVPTWEGWGDRTSEENLALRNELFGQGVFDGYLAYQGGEPVGWCQVGPRDRLRKLVEQFDLAPDPAAWAITCFLVASRHRRRGVSRALLDGVLSDLPARGARRVEAFPRIDGDEDELSLWNGPEPLFAAAGFERERDVGQRALMARALGTS